MPQNNKIKSEYSKSFKIYKESAQNEYSENVKFRLARRNQEISHQPWAWLDIDLSDNESANDETNNVLKIESENESVSKETENQVVENNTNNANSSFDEPGFRDLNPDDISDQQFIQLLKKKAMKRAMEMRNQQTEPQISQSNGNTRRPHHPLKGNSKTFQRSASRSSDQKKVPANPVKTSCSTNPPEKPFFSYGWGSQSCESNRKKTFNIKSEIDVHPSAIRAWKTRENCKQKEKSNSAGNSGRPKTAGNGKCRDPCSARNINIDNQAAMDWLSEYQIRFPSYDYEIYRRGLANLAPRGHFARLDTPRTCRI